MGIINPIPTRTTGKVMSGRRVGEEEAVQRLEPREENCYLLKGGDDKRIHHLGGGENNRWEEEDGGRFTKRDRRHWGENGHRLK